jgi:hypothetical protein
MKFVIICLVFAASIAHSSELKSFDGVWQTTFGKMRLIQKSDGIVFGKYQFDLTSKIDGKIKNAKLEFRYTEKNISGSGWFKLNESGSEFTGEWTEDGKVDYKKWSGKKIEPVKDLKWLVVIEACWENSYLEKEFLFGDMLKSFFDRNPSVEVRRRTFTDEASLRLWLEDVQYIPEDVLLVIAGHGTSNGFVISNKDIPPTAISDSIKYASNVKVLHFSSCLIMKDNYAKQILKELEATQPNLLISGYTTRVDWGVSAIFEMIYFDEILGRNQRALEAAKTALKLYPLAGKSKLSGVPYAPAGFTYLTN